MVYVSGFGFSFVFLFLWVAFIAYSFPLVWILIFVFLFLITFLPTAGYYGYTYVVDEVATVSSRPTALRPDLGDDKEGLLQI